MRTEKYGGKLLIIEHAIRRGGYQPTAQNKLKITKMLGESVPVSYICTIQPNTQLTNLAGGW